MIEDGRGIVFGKGLAELDIGEAGVWKFEENAEGLFGWLFAIEFGIDWPSPPESRH